MALTPAQSRDLATLHHLRLPLVVHGPIEHQIRMGHFSFAGNRKAILHAMARSAFVWAWAQEQEAQASERDADPPWSAGGDIADYAPKTTPVSARRWAEDVVAEFERQTQMPIELLYWYAENKEGRHEWTPTADAFGWLLAMQAQGHGVSWFDGHPQFEPLASVDIYRDYWPS